MSDEKLLGKKADLLIKTGKLLLESLADSNRVDRNLRRVALYMGIDSANFNMHITYTTIMLNISDGENSATRLIKCSHHAANMDRITAISKLTWLVAKENVHLEEYEKKLKEIEGRKKLYSRAVLVFGSGFACAAFCKLFGADYISALITFVSVLAAMFVRTGLHKYEVNNYLNVFISSFVAVSLACIFSFVLGMTKEYYAVFACILFLVPGVPLVNSVDDMINGFTIVGFTRALVATLTVMSISLGMFISLEIFEIVDIGEVFPPEKNLLLAAVFAAIAACGFALIFNVPKRALWVAAVGGSITVFTRNILMIYLDFSLPFATFIAVLIMGFFALQMVHVVHVPMHVITVPSAIPLIPGALIYRSMMGVLYINEYEGVDENLEVLAQTLHSGLVSAFTLAAISVGVVTALVIARKRDRVRWGNLWRSRQERLG